MLSAEDKEKLKSELMDADKSIHFIKEFEEYEQTSASVAYLQLCIDNASYKLQYIMKCLKKEKIITDEEKSFFKPVYYFDRASYNEHKEYLMNKYSEERKIPNIPKELFELYDISEERLKI